MAMISYWVHQYSLRELLDDSFDLFKERATTLLLAGLIPFILVAVYVVVMRVFIVPENFLPENSQHALENLLSSREFWIYYGGFALVNGLAFTVTVIAQCRIAAAHALGQPMSLGRAFKAMLKPGLSLIVLGVVYSMIAGFISYIAGIIVGAVVAVIVGFIAGAIGGGDVGFAVGGITFSVTMAVAFMIVMVLVMTYFLAAPVALACEHVGPFAAIGRSSSTATSNFKAHAVTCYAFAHIPLFMLPCIAIVVLGGQMITAYLAPTGALVVVTLVSQISNIVFFGIMSCFMTLVYLDGRSRRDALDLLMLAREVGLGTEMEQALYTRSTAPLTAAYPDYSRTPVTPARPTVDSVGVPAPKGAAQMVAGSYPDYSAPPPPLDPVVEAPVSAADEVTPAPAGEGDGDAQ